ncbi:hypothetical protein [Saccharococcus sp. Marseille-Q5394]|uniref:hypothetical protein n=1 Tax=Saccharococcus sp. Marseille-Q5394 TaxID=2972778 RepID=UPI0021C767D9|nr:hypothetical protein [Saccharococcus sp. Marseille-Q5394]
MKRIRKQILSLFLVSLLVITSLPANATFAAVDNTAIEAQIMEELEAILETIDVTDPTELTDDTNLQDSTDLTEQTEDPLLQESTELDNTTESQDMNKSPEITTDEEIEAYKNWEKSLRIIPRALASGTNCSTFRLSFY